MKRAVESFETTLAFDNQVDTISSEVDLQLAPVLRDFWPKRPRQKKQSDNRLQRLKEQSFEVDAAANKRVFKLLRSGYLAEGSTPSFVCKVLCGLGNQRGRIVSASTQAPYSTKSQA